jgi:hypothetical protein
MTKTNRHGWWLGPLFRVRVVPCFNLSRGMRKPEFLVLPIRIAQSVCCGRPGDRGSIPGRGERIFPLASVSRPALGPTQPPVQWVPGVLSPGLKRGRGVTLTTHPHLVQRSRTSRSYTSSPPKAFMACSRTALALAWSYQSLLTNEETLQ